MSDEPAPDQIPDPTRPRVRPAREADLDALAALEAACFDEPGSPAWSRDLLAGELRQRTATVLVAEEADEAPEPPLGYASFRHVGHESELLRVAVAPAARSRGVGRALIEAGLALLRRRHVTTCFLEARPANAPALALYARLGFREIARRKRYFPDGSDALILEADLSSGRIDRRRSG